MNQELILFAQQVKDCREAQKAFFKNRTPEALKESKRFEKELDMKIDSIISPKLF